MTRTFTLSIALLLGLTATLAAQERPACTYDQCALRMDPGGWFSRPQIVRGNDGDEVADLGIVFGPDLTEIVAGSDSAVYYASIFEDNYTSGNIISALAAVALGATMVGADQDASEAFLLTSLATGIGFTIWGTHRLQLSHRSLSKALWWYNRDLSRPSPER